MKENDWLCPQCANHNFSSRINCQRCNTLREGYEQGDWVCRYCKAHCSVRQTTCHQCNLPRDAGGIGGDGGCMAPLGGQAGGQTGMYGHVLPNGLIVYSNGLIGSVDQPLAGAQLGGHISQPISAQGGQPTAGQVVQPQVGQVVQPMLGQVVAPLGGQLPAQLVPGAQLPGFMAMQVGAPIPGQPPRQPLGPAPEQGRGKVRDGDWACPSCANHNFSHRAHCNRCQTLRPDFKDGDWVCSGCQNLNFSIRDQCNRCKLPRSLSTGVGGGAGAPQVGAMGAMGGMGAAGILPAPAVSVAGAVLPAAGALGARLPFGAVALGALTS